MRPTQVPLVGWQMVVASANRSASPAELNRFVLALGVVCGLVCAFSFVQGNLLAPLFGALNVALVAWVLRVVWRSADQSDQVSWDGQEICVERRRGARIACARFNPYWVRLERRAAIRHGDAQRLLLGSHGRFVELGRFLDAERRRRFAEEIAALLVAAHNESAPEHNRFR